MFREDNLLAQNQLTVNRIKHWVAKVAFHVIGGLEDKKQLSKNEMKFYLIEVSDTRNVILPRFTQKITILIDND